MTVKRTVALRKKILWMQIFGATGSMLSTFMVGVMGGWTSPYLAKLTADDSPIPITLDQASWVASLMNLGRLLAAIPTAASVYYLGSKKTLLLNGIPLILSWFSFIMADSVVWLYVGRFVAGYAAGITYGSFQLYLGEVSSPAIRGALVTFASIGLPLGTVLGNAIGAYVSIQVFAWISLVPIVIQILIFMWVPESPHWLIRVNKTEEAKKSISKYNPDMDVEEEAKSLQDFVNATKSITIADKLREFNIPANRKAGVIIVLLYTFMQFSGMNSMLFYLEIILTSSGLTVILPATMVIIAGVTGAIGGLAAVYLIDKLGRRLLFSVSTLGVVVSLVALGAHFALLYNNVDPDGRQWLVILSILAYEVFMFAGVIPIPNTVCSELFAPNIKSIAACFASITMGIYAFISSKTYQPLLDATNEYVVFWLYAAVAGLGLIFGLTIMPETKGKSLQDIQNMLHKSNLS